MGSLPTEEMAPFHAWASRNGLGYDLYYSEAENLWTVRITSPAPAEEYYQKRCYSLLDLIERYREQTGLEAK